MIKTTHDADVPVAVTNPCKLCAPLGASLVFKGVAGALPLLHGSQGCSTYIRRFLIGHFREPADIASSSFSEETTIFGGGDNLRLAIRNIVDQYHPSLIGIATTCLAETIGEDVAMHLRSLEAMNDLPPIVHVSTPSYAGTHVDGFRNAVYALINRFARCRIPHEKITLFPGMLSCAELRYLRALCAAFGREAIAVPDYSLSLDGGIWDEYHLLPEGGTTIDDLVATGSSCAAISFESGTASHQNPLTILKERCGVMGFSCGVPLGVDACDALCTVLSDITGKLVPESVTRERSRLIDSYVDGHKFVADTKVALYGDPDQVTGLARFCGEIGLHVTAVVTGSRLPHNHGIVNAEIISDDADFTDLLTLVTRDKPDLLIGSSKGYHIAHALGIPLVRTGFPIHDRLGGQRLMHIGYEGTQQLFETIVNTLIERRQEGSSVGYMTW